MSIVMGERLIGDIIESLQYLGYPQSDENSLKTIISDRTQFCRLVSWLSKELNVLTGGVIRTVSSLEGTADEDSFNLELSSFLAALNCPFPLLVSGPMNMRLDSEMNRLTLLEYLTTETQAARMVRKSTDAKRMRKENLSSPPSCNAALLMRSLGLSVPRKTIDLKEWFKAIHKAIVTLQPKPVPLLITQSLESAHWDVLNRVYRKLLQDFTIRRMALLKRLDVTIESFGWSARMKDKQSQIVQVYTPIRQNLTNEPSVELGDVLAARPDVLIIEKTSSANVREKTQTSIAKVIIESVPDRGGRTTDMVPPPPEMPSWSKRNAAPRDQGGPRGKGGSGRNSQEHQSGYQSGFQPGHQSGFQPGHQSGYQSGYQLGDRQQHQQHSQQYNDQRREPGYIRRGNGDASRHIHNNAFNYSQRGDQQHNSQRGSGGGGGVYNYNDNDYNVEQRGQSGFRQRNSTHYDIVHGYRAGSDYRQQYGDYNTGRVADAGWNEYSRRGGQRGAYRGAYRGTGGSGHRY